MKTAETWESEQEWVLDKREEMIAVFRAIQLDAIKHGMTLAAEAAKEALYVAGRHHEGRVAYATILNKRDNFQLP